MSVYTVERPSESVNTVTYAARRDAEEFAEFRNAELLPKDERYVVMERDVRPRTKHPEDYIITVYYGYKNSKREVGGYTGKGVDQAEALMHRCVFEHYCDWFHVVMQLTPSGCYEWEFWQDVEWSPEQQEAIREVLTR